MSKIKCHFNNLIKSVYLYNNFATFVRNIGKEFQINNNDIKNLQFYILYDNNLKIGINENTYKDYFIQENYINDIYCELKKEIKKIIIKDKREMNNIRGKSENNNIKERRNLIEIGKRNISGNPKQEINNYFRDNKREQQGNNNLKESKIKEKNFNDNLLSDKMESNIQKENGLMKLNGEDIKNLQKQMNEMKEDIFKLFTLNNDLKQQLKDLNEKINKTNQDIFINYKKAINDKFNNTESKFNEYKKDINNKLNNVLKLNNNFSSIKKEQELINISIDNKSDLKNEPFNNIIKEKENINSIKNNSNLNNKFINISMKLKESNENIPSSNNNNDKIYNSEGSKINISSENKKKLINDNYFQNIHISKTINHPNANISNKKNINNNNNNYKNVNNNNQYNKIDFNKYIKNNNISKNINLNNNINNSNNKNINNQQYLKSSYNSYNLINESDSQISNKNNNNLKDIFSTNEKSNSNQNKKEEKEKCINEEIITPIDQHDFSCIFFYDKNIKVRYSNIKTLGKIKINMKIKNNGVNDIPKKTEITSLKNDNESQFYIHETMVNNGNSIKAGEIINLTIFLFPKTNMVIGNNNFTFKLRNQYFGIIGKENNINIYVIKDS